jgi:hypothetical protein
VVIDFVLTDRQEYMNNIRVVDDIVRETEEVIAAFYGDAETAFIFTADHGMSVIGNHGDGRTSPLLFLRAPTPTRPGRSG